MIIVIGRWRTQSNDEMVMDAVALWLADHGKPELGERLFEREIEEYDIVTLPERGDAIHAIRDAKPGELELVVALHLCGIDRTPGGIAAIDDGYCYEGQNGYLLSETLAKGALLAAWGDQPWLANCPFDKTEIRERLFVYGRKA